MQSTHPISLSHLAFSWPDGTPAFDDLSTVFAAGRTGLVGPNGTGKTALLRLIAGELAPSSGTLSTSSPVAYLPQKLTLRTGQNVTELLGLAEKRRALAQVLAGHEENMAGNLELIGDDWDLEERAVALLAGYGLPAAGPEFLDRTVGMLSGGEAMIAALAGLELAAKPITLLDEPTNNLDRTARERLHQAIARWPGTLVVATHDRALLERVDAIAELRPVRSRAWTGDRVQLVRHGGNWDVFQAELAAENETAERLVRDAGARLAKEKRQRIEAETKIARRAKAGRKAASGLPPIIANERRKQAEESAGKMRGTMGNRESDAATALADAKDSVPAESRIRIDLPDTAVPQGRTVLDAPASTVALGMMHDGGTPLSPDMRVTLRGPERGHADRAQWRWKDDPSGRAGASGRRAAWIPAAADRFQRGRRILGGPGRFTDRPRKRARGGGDGATVRCSGTVGPVSLPRGAGQPAGGRTLRRGTVQGGPGPDPVGAARTAAVAPGRAHQQLGPRFHRAAGVGARRI